MTMFVPRISAGIRSGVNWMRLNEMSSTSLKVRTSGSINRCCRTKAFEEFGSGARSDAQGHVEGYPISHNSFPISLSIFDFDCRLESPAKDRLLFSAYCKLLTAY